MQNPFDVYQSNQKSKKKPKEQAKKAPGLKQKKRAKKRKPSSSKKKDVSWPLLLSCLFGLSLSFYVMMYAEDVMVLLSRIEVGVNQSHAQDAEKVAEDGKKQAAKTTATKQDPVSQHSSSADPLTMKNASVYNALKDKRRELEKKERRLAQLEEELQIQKEQIEKQLKEMQEMRSNISERLDRKVAADQESIDKLVGVYSNMKPQNAAVILSSVDEELAIKVLGKMKKGSAAAILDFVDPRKAQVLSEKFTGLKQ